MQPLPTTRITLLCILFLLLCIAHGQVRGADDAAELLGATPAEPTAEQRALAEATAKAAGVKLPPAVQSQIDKADAAIAKIDAKAKEDAGKVRADLVVGLTKAQGEATRKGDLTLALGLKARIEELSRMLPVVKVAKPDPKFLGLYDFDFHNGHAGRVEVRKGDATADGNQGDISKADGGWVITWSNHTRWTVTIDDGALSVSASDGHSQLVPCEPKGK